MKQLLFAAIIATSLIACQTAPKSTFDLKTAKTEIEAANKELSDFLSKGDSVGVANAYAKEGKLMGNNMPSVTGTVNLTSVWGAFLRSGIGGITLTTTEIWGDENYITEEGTYTISLKDGKQVDNGKYLVLWKKEDGKWKLYRDISNSDLPLPSPAK